MADMEPFTLVEESTGPHQLFDDVKHFTSAKTADHDYQYLKALRVANPGMIVTSIPQTNLNLVAFALAGNATLELDTETDSFVAWRGFVGPATRGGKGQLGQAVQFAKYRYSWGNEQFLLFTVDSMQYVLKEKRGSEPLLGPSKATDELIMAAGEWSLSDAEVVWVFDGYWYQDKSLFDEVKKASWDKVILDENQKKELQSVSKTFFSSKKVYEDLGVPWKRGIMFYGPPGNGKTVSIKALMHTLLMQPRPIPTLYVKAASRTFQISAVFAKARQLAPCLLILEDIETIVNQETRSYFFNELDGLSGNDGLFVVASTNYLDRLDPGLTSRPSRFDRKYLFPEPNEHERTLYCQYWRRKLQDNKKVDFPEKLCPAMARITENFSFAFLQECFVATLLVIANEDQEQGREKDGLDRYKLWRLFKQQADVLRKEIHHDSAATVEAVASAPPPAPSVGPAHGSRSTYTYRGAAYDSTGLERRSARPTDDAAKKWGLLTDSGETGDASRQAAGPSELPYLTPGGYKLKLLTDTAFEWRPPF